MLTQHQEIPIPSEARQNYSRRVLRLVAYMLRRTLGWLDKDGNPIEQDIKVSYNDLVTKAKISRGAVAKAIDDAIEAGFILRTRQGSASRKGQAAQAASFILCWDDSSAYLKNPTAFRGFYSGDGHRTPIPNAFFDHVVPHETLAVIKVVGTVLRHTVGYQNQFGGRRSEAPLSYSYFQKYTHLLHRPTLAEALHEAIDRGYIRRVSDGCFDPRAGKASRPASYAVNWLQQATSRTTSSKTEPSLKQFKNRTGSSSETAPDNQFKNRTHRKTVPNNTYKQQGAAAYQLLQRKGFDDRVARELSNSRSIKDIEQQIVWMEHRMSNKNYLGMLRRAIEDSWPEPIAAKHAKKQRNTLAE